MNLQWPIGQYPTWFRYDQVAAIDESKYLYTWIVHTVENEVDEAPHCEMFNQIKE